MATPAQSQAKSRRAKEALKRANDEIRKLTDHMNEGTLHQKRLESGLRNLTRLLAGVPTHHP